MLSEQLNPANYIPDFGDDDYSKVKPNNKNFVKAFGLSLTTYSILYGETKRNESCKIVRPSKTERDEAYTVGILGKYKILPLRENLAVLEVFIADKMVTRKNSEKKASCTVWAIPRDKKWVDYYNTCDEATVRAAWDQSTTEAQRMSLAEKHVYIGDGKYLNGLKEDTGANLKEVEFQIPVEETGMTMINGKPMNYKREVFTPKKVSEMPASVQVHIQAKNLKFSFPVEAKRFEAGEEFGAISRTAFNDFIKKVEGKTRQSNNPNDDGNGGSNYLCKLFANSLSKLQQRNCPRNNVGGGPMAQAIGAGIISSKKASNQTNASMAETAVVTWSGVLRSHSSYVRNQQLDLKKSSVSGMISKMVTAINQYCSNEDHKQTLAKAGLALRERGKTDIGRTDFENDLMNFIDHFGEWAVNYCTGSADQVIIRPGDLSMMHFWDDTADDKPIALRIARFTNVRMESLETLPTTAYCWQDQEAEIYSRIVVNQNLYDAPSESIMYSAGSKIFMDSPRQQPMTHNAALGIFPQGGQSRVILNQEILEVDLKVIRVLTQRSKARDTDMVEATTCYINPRGYNGNYVDSVLYLDLQKNVALTLEDVVKAIREDKKVDVTKTTKSTWYKVADGEKIKDGGPTSITNFLGIGPLRKHNYGISQSGSDKDSLIEETLAVISSGLSNAAKVLKKVSTKPKQYAEGEFQVLEARNWDLLYGTKLAKPTYTLPERFTLGKRGRDEEAGPSGSSKVKPKGAPQITNEAFYRAMQQAEEARRLAQQQDPNDYEMGDLGLRVTKEGGGAS